tara:strand:+ start:176 stop:925 length:750 start_codon:yes stop_codon:yes gene_type:complete
MRLNGKVALITGAARGQGECEAKLFSAEGATVVVADVLSTLGEKVAQDISSGGGKATFVKLDVSSEKDWVLAIQHTLDKFKALNVLVNNASIYRTTTIENTSMEEWDDVISTNARGAFLGTKYVIPAMRKANGGSIINICSTTGIVGSSRGGAYGASKAAVRILTKHAAIQHASEGIRVNSISPGSIDTEMIAENIGTPQGRAASIKRIPAGRIGTAEDVAYGALFLASDESSFITGSDLLIDGGMTAQ